MEDKIFYSIKEVSEKFGVTYATLRYWEKNFKNLTPSRNRRGVRMYTQKNIEQIEKILYLVKEKGLTIEGAKKVLYQKQEQNEDLLQVKKNLLQAREELIKLRDILSE